MNEERMKELLKRLIRSEIDRMGNDYHSVMLLIMAMGIKKSELEELGFSFPNFYSDLEKIKSDYPENIIELIIKCYES